MKKLHPNVDFIALDWLRTDYALDSPRLWDAEHWGKEASILYLRDRLLLGKVHHLVLRQCSALGLDVEGLLRMFSSSPPDMLIEAYHATGNEPHQLSSFTARDVVYPLQKALEIIRSCPAPDFFSDKPLDALADFAGVGKIIDKRMEEEMDQAEEENQLSPQQINAWNFADSIVEQWFSLSLSQINESTDTKHEEEWFRMRSSGGWGRV